LYARIVADQAKRRTKARASAPNSEGRQPKTMLAVWPFHRKWTVHPQDFNTLDSPCFNFRPDGRAVIAA
jgi:hypothetical protein